MHQNAIQRFDLSDRVAWVVGGAGLLGSAVCHALAEHGAHVVVSDLRLPKAQELVDAIRAKGLSAEAGEVDATSEVSIVAAADAVVKRHGRIDCAVNMTWYYKNVPMTEMSAAEWEACMKVTLTGAFVVGREAFKHMSARGKGSIVQFSSMYGVVAPDPRIYPPHLNPNPIHYGAAKAGVLSMVRYQAVMGGPKGVRVNGIVPGSFPLPDSQQKDDAFMAGLSSKAPMGRVGQAPEIAGAVVFLCSDASSFVTGTQIVIDGGWTAW